MSIVNLKNFEEKKKEMVTYTIYYEDKIKNRKRIHVFFFF